MLRLFDFKMLWEWTRLRTNTKSEDKRSMHTHHIEHFAKKSRVFSEAIQSVHSGVKVYLKKASDTVKFNFHEHIL